MILKKILFYLFYLRIPLIIRFQSIFVWFCDEVMSVFIEDCCDLSGYPLIQSIWVQCMTLYRFKLAAPEAQPDSSTKRTC